MSDHSLLLGTNTAAAMEPNFQAQVQPCKRRKGSETGKTVITVRIGEDGGKLKNIGGHAFDHWSWRKYGQKAIKGSPYPRGYYKCTSRGCNAKKQVERSKTDDSTLVVTYTCTHNHPSPSLQGSRPTQQVKDHARPKSLKQGNRADEEKEEASQEDSQDKGSSISFEYLLKSSSAQDMMIMEKEGYFQGNIGKLGFVLEEEPMISCLHQHVMTSSALKSEGSDIFDELEDL